MVLKVERLCIYFLERLLVFNLYKAGELVWRGGLECDYVEETTEKVKLCDRPISK